MPGLSVHELRKLVEAEGARAVAAKLVEAVNFKPDDPLRFSESDFSVRNAWEGLVGGCAETLMDGPRPLQRFSRLTGNELQEAEVKTTAFATFVQALIKRRIIKEYELEAGVAERLCRQEKSDDDEITVPGYEAPPEAADVLEGQPYPDLHIGKEKKVTGSMDKFGLIVRVTRELVQKDKTGTILSRARKVGQWCGRTKAKKILDGVQDVNTTVWRPGGTAEALYRTSVGTRSKRLNKTAANALVDWTDLDVALALFDAMYLDLMGTSGEVVGQPERLQVLVPSALGMTARRIRRAIHFSYTAESSGVGPTSRWQNDYQEIDIVVSKRLASASTWYIGDFQAQFTWYYAWLLEVMEEYESGAAWFERDVLYSARASEKGGLVAEDDCYVVQCPAS